MRRALIATGAVVEPLVIDPGDLLTCRDDRCGPRLPDVLIVHRVPGLLAGGWTAPAPRRVRAARAARAALARPGMLAT